MPEMHYILIGAYIGGFIAIVLSVFLICHCCHRKKKSQQPKSRDIIEIHEIPPHQQFSPANHRRWTGDRPVLSYRPSGYMEACQQKQLSDEFMQRYLSKLHNAYFDSRRDQCFCTICSPTLSSYLSQAGYMYTLPQNWYRIGLSVDRALAEGQNIWSEWCTSYHGTSFDRAVSIIQNRQLLIPGDIGNNNQSVGIVHGTGTGYFFTTPCIKYASLGTYSRPLVFTSSITGENYQVKIVIQLRQKPGTFRVQRGTIRAFYPPNPPVCNIIKHEQLEWYSNARSSTVPYGLLIKFGQIPSTRISRRTISSQNSYLPSRRSTTTDTKSAIHSSSFSFSV